MYPAHDAHEISILLRTSRELDLVGDVTATVECPSDLLAWAVVLSRPEVLAWRSRDAGHRYVHVTAWRNRAPVRGQVTAVLDCDQHRAFWSALGLDPLVPGDRRALAVTELSSAWDVMPLTPPDTGQTSPPEPPPAPAS